MNFGRPHKEPRDPNPRIRQWRQASRITSGPARKCGATGLIWHVLSRRMNRWRAALLAGLTVGFVTNLVATATLDGSCSGGLCDAGWLSFYMLLTFWVPFAAAAALAFLWLWRAGRPPSN